MKASDVMTVGAASVHPDTSVAEAARIMLQHRISGLPVVDKEGKLLGMVTEGDFLRRAEIGTEQERPRWLELWLSAGELAQEYVHAHARKVEDVMTHDVVTVKPDTPLSEAVELMERHDFKRLPVVRDGKVVGIVSRANLLLALSRRVPDLSGVAVDDLAIRKGILDELKKQDWAPATTLDIVVHDGAVELRGTVMDERVREAVRVMAENAPGVKSVTDNIQVIPYTTGWV